MNTSPTHAASGRQISNVSSSDVGGNRKVAFRDIAEVKDEVINETPSQTYRRKTTHQTKFSYLKTSVDSPVMDWLNDE